MIPANRILSKDGRSKFNREYIEVIVPVILKYAKCEFLEIGTARGAVSLSCVENIIKVGGHIDTVDFLGDLLKCGKRAPTLTEKQARGDHVGEMIEEFGLHAIYSHTVNGSNAFFDTNTKKYDVIFIDGDHTYEQVKLDIDNSADRLNKGGIMFLDDISDWTQGLGIEENAKRAFNEFNRSGFMKHMYPTIERFGIIERDK